MKSHSRLKDSLVIFTQCKKMTFRPVRREADANTVSCAMEKVLGNIGPLCHFTTGGIDVF
jgi:hypothetical protein